MGFRPSINTILDKLPKQRRTVCVGVVLVVSWHCCLCVCRVYSRRLKPRKWNIWREPDCEICEEFRSKSMRLPERNNKRYLARMSDQPIPSPYINLPLLRSLTCFSFFLLFIYLLSLKA